MERVKELSRQVEEASRNKTWIPKITEEDGVFRVYEYHWGTYGGHYKLKNISFGSRADAVWWVNNFMYGRVVIPK